MSIELNILKKVCRKCKAEKEVSEFNKMFRDKHYLRSYCKVCDSKRAGERLKSIPEEEAARKRKRLYGIDKKDFDTLLSKQSGKCAICLQELLEGKKTHLDHCHKSKVIRGILCKDCNLGLGRFKDNIEYLQNAIDYLKEHQE